MPYSLNQVAHALNQMNINTELIENAISQLESMLSQLNEVSVKGREQVDSMLGCMIALESIVGSKEVL